MEELLPVLLGAIAGWITTTLVRRRLSTPARLLIAGLAGGLATLITGEFRQSWAFLFIDIPLGVVGAVITSELWTRRTTRSTG